MTIASRTIRKIARLDVKKNDPIRRLKYIYFFYNPIPLRDGHDNTADDHALSNTWTRKIIIKRLSNDSRNYEIFLSVIIIII